MGNDGKFLSEAEQEEQLRRTCRHIVNNASGQLSQMESDLKAIEEKMGELARQLRTDLEQPMREISDGLQFSRNVGETECREAIEAVLETCRSVGSSLSR